MPFWRLITAHAWGLAGKYLTGYCPQHSVVLPPNILYLVCPGCGLVCFTSRCFFNAINNFMALTVPSTPPTNVLPSLPCIYLDVHSAEAWIELGQEREKLPSLQTMSPSTNIKFSWYRDARLLVVYTLKSVALWRWGDTSWKSINVEESEIEKVFFHGGDNPNEEVADGLSLEVVFERPAFDRPSKLGRTIKFNLVIAATFVAAIVLTKQSKKNKKLTREWNMELSKKTSNKDDL